MHRMKSSAVCTKRDQHLRGEGAKITYFFDAGLFLRRFCTILGTSLHSARYTCSIEGTSDDVISTPGRSLTLPPLMSTTLCSWRLWPIPGIYAVTSMPFVRRTLATFLRAEFGFLGVTVLTDVHTPLFCGDFVSVGTLLREFIPLKSAGAVDFLTVFLRPSLTN